MYGSNPTGSTLLTIKNLNKMENIDYEAEVRKVYPEAECSWAMGHCVLLDGHNNHISDLIKGVNAVAQQESWKNAYERIHRPQSQFNFI